MLQGEADDLLISFTSPQFLSTFIRSSFVTEDFFASDKKGRERDNEVTSAKNGISPEEK